MNHLCCIGITLAARIIAALGLSTSILMINILVSEYFSRKDDNDFFKAIETWTMLGLNWTQFLKNSQIPKQVEIILVCFLGWSLMLLFSSASLAVGTVYRKPKYAVLWLYLQMISIVDQTVALTVHLAQSSHQEFDDLEWHTPVYSIHLLITVYFWMVVFSAREDWMTRPHHFNDFIYHESSEETPRDSNLPKTPSFLAQNLTYESGQPHIPPKYDIV